MNDVIANRIASFRARLTCLDMESHVAIWQNQAPLKLTAKVTEARNLTAALITRAAQQSAPVTGNATSKRKEEEELENEAHKLGRAVASYARDVRNHALAENYDLPISTWRRLRDEALIQRARLLETDAGALVGGRCRRGGGIRDHRRRGGGPEKGGRRLRVADRGPAGSDR